MAAAIAQGLVVSAHDPSEGGIAVAACEWAFAGRTGLDLTIDTDEQTMFGEGPGRYLVEVAPESADQFAALVPSATLVGQVTTGSTVRLGEVELSLDEIESAWKSQP